MKRLPPRTGPSRLPLKGVHDVANPPVRAPVWSRLMGEVVNLNKARKARDKAEARRVADANRLTFGRTRAERLTTQKERDRDAARLDGHKLDEPE